MPRIRKACSVEQCMNFGHNVRAPLGVITSLTIGMTPLLADMTITDPMGAIETAATSASVGQAGTMPIVAALRSVEWAWGMGEVMPIGLSGVVSPKTRGVLLGLLYNTVSDVNVSIAFTIYEFDAGSGTYFVSFSSNAFVSGATVVKGLLQRDDAGELKLTVEDDMFSLVQSPPLYGFTIEVAPSPLPQRLYVAAYATNKLVKTWGQQS